MTLSFSVLSLIDVASSSCDNVRSSMEESIATDRHRLEMATEKEEGREEDEGREGEGKRRIEEEQGRKG